MKLHLRALREGLPGLLLLVLLIVAAFLVDAR